MDLITETALYDGGDRNSKEVTGGAKSEKFRGVKGGRRGRGGLVATARKQSRKAILYK